MTNEDQLKTCRKCRTDKPLEEFSRDRRKSDGRRSRCKECVCAQNRAYYAEHAEERREYDKAYYAANAERVRARAKAYREANAEEVREKKRSYYAEHAEQEQKRVRDWEARNREAAEATAWATSYRIRARAAGFVPVVEKFTRAELIAYWGNGERCIYCDGPFEELDHLYPVALGAVHTVETCAPACVQCNRAGGQDARRFLRGLTERERCRQVIVGAARARLAPIA